jgi:hypothetical protein
MTEDRKSLLESIGFVWELRNKDTWMKSYQELKKYAAKEGNCNVPRNYPENKQLGIWVMHQRTQNRLLQEGKQSTMTEDRKHLLECIGFVWKLRSKDKLTHHFQNLKKYAAKEGHCNVPHIYSENKQLGIVHTQRS